jgi:putative endopeptidase
MFMEYGMSASEAAVSTDLVETLLRDICASTLTTEQLYDPSLTYNVYTLDTLEQLYSNVDVPKMLDTIGVSGQDKYIVMDVEQAKKINSLLVEDNLQALKDYSTFVLLNDIAQYSTSGYAKLWDNMKNSLYGITESWGDEKTWKDLTQDLLPWDFGTMYVEEHFSAEDKEAVEEIIEQILKEYEVIIDRQDWMSEATKSKAKRKLETMNVKIGYPDEWPAAKDMMQVTPISEGGSLLSNLLESMQVAIDDSLNRLGNTVDKSEWDFTPQTVNAMYDPLNNEIVLPAAMLQAPFYDSDNTYGANMGGIGFVIAHEVSHAFDSSGALYDEYGNYNIWWTDEELAKYDELSQSIIDYYNNYEMMGVNVNGELTLMENIADLGAVTCITSILGDGTTAESASALDEAFGQMTYDWASEDTVSYMMYLLNTDTHSPNKIRVNAVLSSCDAFYKIYDIKESDKMYVAPEDRVGIWR